MVGRIKNELLQSPIAIIIWFYFRSYKNIYSLTFTDILRTLGLEERLIGRKRAHYTERSRERITILKTRACIICIVIIGCFCAIGCFS